MPKPTSPNSLKLVWTKEKKDTKLICDSYALGSSVQSFSRVWLFNPMNLSTPGLPVHHQLPESTQTYVHRVGDAIQPSYPLSSPFPPALNLSQHQGLFQWVSSSHQVAKVLEFQLQHQSFHPGLISFRMDWLDLSGQLSIGLCSYPNKHNRIMILLSYTDN